MFQIISQSTFNEGRRKSDSCMVVSCHSEVASRLPGFANWVPGEDRGEGVMTIKTTGDEEEICDQGGSKPSPW